MTAPPCAVTHSFFSLVFETNGMIAVLWTPAAGAGALWIPEIVGGAPRPRYVNFQQTRFPAKVSVAVPAAEDGP